MTIEHCNIFSAGNYAIDFFPSPANTGKVMITFTEAGSKTLSGTGFGGAFLLGKGFDVVAVKGCQDSWYQDLPIVALDAINEYLSKLSRPHKWRGAYGSSMGGYAAFMFAQKLRIDVAVALSPQFDISADWDARWAVHASGPMRTMDCDSVRSGCSYVIAYDPHNADRLHVERFAKIIPTEQLILIRVPYCGHPVGYALNDAGALADVVLSAFSGNCNSICPRDIKKSVRTSTSFMFNISAACIAKKHLVWADALMSRALELKPLNSEFNIRAAIIAELRGQVDRAVGYAALAVAVAPKHPNMVFQLAQLLRKKSLNAAALHHLDTVVSLRPTCVPWIKEREDLTRLMNGRATSA